MTQEDKELLYQDLCCRIPYGIKVKYFSTKDFFDCIVQSTNSNKTVDLWTKILNKGACFTFVGLDKITPYLFPLSSITEEQSLELFELFGIDILDSPIEDYIKINEVTGITFFLQKGFDVETHLDKLIDWLLKNHFDFRGLIPKGLALDATGLNIY